MPSTMLMYDAVTPGAVINVAAVKAGTAAVAGYCDANFAQDWITMVHDLPTLSKKQWILSIGTRNGTVCRLFDLEPGNPLDPAQLAANVVAMVKRGVYRPGGYADGNDMPAVREALGRTGLKRQQYTLLLANPTGVRPTAAQLIAQGLDGIQYAWASKGQAPAGTDVSCVLDDFFPPADPPKPKPKPTHDTGTAVAEIHYKSGVKHPFSIHGLPSKDVVFAGKRRTRRFHGGIETGAGGGGWHIHKGLVLPRLRKPK